MEALRQIPPVVHLSLSAGVGAISLIAWMSIQNFDNMGSSVVVLLALVAHALLSIAGLFLTNVRSILPAISCYAIIMVSLPLMIKTVNNMAKHPKKNNE